MKLIPSYKDFLNEEEDFLKYAKKTKSFNYKNIEKAIGLKFEDGKKQRIRAMWLELIPEDELDELGDIDVMKYVKKSMPKVFKLGKWKKVEAEYGNAWVTITKTGELVVMYDGDTVNLFTPKDKEGIEEIDWEIIDDN